MLSSLVKMLNPFKFLDPMVIKYRTLEKWLYILTALLAIYRVLGHAWYGTSWVPHPLMFLIPVALPSWFLGGVPVLWWLVVQFFACVGMFYSHWAIVYRPDSRPQNGNSADQVRFTNANMIALFRASYAFWFLFSFMKINEFIR